MSVKSKIQWTEHTWNPVRGCEVVSPGCKNCYAMRQAHRMNHEGGAYHGLTVLRSGKPVWEGSARLIPEQLDLPIRKTKPARFFVNSMSDLFHKDLSNDEIAAVFGAMAASYHHISFQVLTKRAARLPEWFEWVARRGEDGLSLFPHDSASWRIGQMLQVCLRRAGGNNRNYRRSGSTIRAAHGREINDPRHLSWPLEHVHLGVSAENQETFDERVPLLLRTPASVRWVSLEPLLGPINMGKLITGLDWVVVGGESGPGARVCDRLWLQNLVDQCRAAEVPVFVKQLGAQYVDPEQQVGGSQCQEQWVNTRLSHSKGGEIGEFPLSLRVREYP